MRLRLPSPAGRGDGGEGISGWHSALVTSCLRAFVVEFLPRAQALSSLRIDISRYTPWASARGSGE